MSSSPEEKSPIEEIIGAPAVRALKSIKALRVKVAQLERQNNTLLDRLKELEEEVSSSREGERYRALVTMALWGKEKISSFLDSESSTRSVGDHEEPSDTPILRMEEAEPMSDRTLERIEKKVTEDIDESRSHSI